MTKNHYLRFYIELSLKYVVVGLNLAILKDNLYGNPPFFFFFLKGKMIVHEIKTKFKVFVSDFLIYNLL